MPDRFSGPSAVTVALETGEVVCESSTVTVKPFLRYQRKSIRNSGIAITITMMIQTVVESPGEGPGLIDVDAVVDVDTVEDADPVDDVVVPKFSETDIQ